VVKNYLRKVYDKLGVADRLELALYCLNSRILDSSVKPPARPEPPAHTSNPEAISPANPDTPEKLS
jgi:hypothetical protein